MSNEHSEILNKEVLSQFMPLGLINENFYGELFEKVVVANFSESETIVKNPVKSALRHYLVEGDVELRYSFVDRRTLSSNDAQFRFPLEEIIKEQGSIKAVDHCIVLIVNVDFIDELLIRGQNQDYKILHIDELADDQGNRPIDDNSHEDWTEGFIQSPLAANLSPTDMHRLFSCLEDKEVIEGEEIIRLQSPGDFFYIIKQGFANVITEENGPYKGEVFLLSGGDYFGDEALMADTLRNATVVMSTDGILGCLSKSNFDKIIRKSLINLIEPSQVSDLKNVTFLDVRLPLEYKHYHRDNCINIPVNHLRQQLPKLNVEDVYVLTPEGGRRSELAIYLLRQVGLQAYLLKEQVGKEFPSHHSSLSEELISRYANEA